MQKSFCDIDHSIVWIDNGGPFMDYKFEGDGAAKAKAARDAEAKRLKAQGYIVKKSTSNGLRSLGGIGTRKPHLQYHAKWFNLDAFLPTSVSC